MGCCMGWWVVSRAASAVQLSLPFAAYVHLVQAWAPDGFVALAQLQTWQNPCTAYGVKIYSI
jgi:hypothetical protein